MAKEASNRKYLTLNDVRISHRRNDDSIHLTSSDDDFPEGFHLALQKGTRVEAQVRELLEERSMISVEQSLFPRMVAWHDSYADDSPGFFPLGAVVEGGTPQRNPYTGEKFLMAGIDLFNTYPRKNCGLGGSTHVLIVGKSGRGKSTMIQNILTVVFAKNPTWDVIFLDPRRDLPSYDGRPKVRYFQTLDECETALQALTYTVDSRMEQLRQEQVNSFTQLATIPKPIVVAVEEISLLVGQFGVKTLEGGAEARAQDRMRDCIEHIVRLGQAAGVYVLASSQTSSEHAISKTLMSNFDTKILCGSYDRARKESLFGVDVQIDDVLGRFYIQTRAGATQGQMFLHV